MNGETMQLSYKRQQEKVGFRWHRQIMYVILVPIQKCTFLMHLFLAHLHSCKSVEYGDVANGILPHTVYFSCSLHEIQFKNYLNNGEP